MFTQLQKKLQQSLPGKEAQFRMAPSIRIANAPQDEELSKNAKIAAVLILFYFKNQQLHLAFIKRTTYDGVHSGQIAFPGGRYEKTDPDLIFTALREAEEEIGIDASKVHVLGELTKLYVPPSNFVILPVVGYTNEILHFKIQEDEVESVLEVPFADFLKQENKTTEIISHPSITNFEVPCYKIQNEIIWGATAMVMSELLTIIKSINDQH